MHMKSITMSNESVSNNFATFEELFDEDVPKTTEKSPPGTPGRTIMVNQAVNDRLLRMTLPKIPSVRATPKQAEIISMFDTLRAAKCVDAIGALPRDPLDTRLVSNKDRASASLTTNLMNFTTFGKDGAFFTLATQVNPNAYSDTSFKEYVKALEYSNQFVGSSGNMEGLIHRLSTGLLSSKNVRINKKRAVEYANKVLKYNNVTLEFRDRTVTELLRELSREGLIKFNKSSNAGVPFNGKVGNKEIFKAAVGVAETVLDKIAKGRYAEYVGEERKALLAVLLKNKQDFYKIDNLQVKIRPYYVYSLYERMLYSIVQATLKPIRFDQTYLVESGSAVGFSFNNGGGDRLYEWIAKDREYGSFDSIWYGDDQLWVFTLTDGKVYIATPDFSHMDLSLVADWGDVAYKVWRPYYQNLDKTWDSVLKLNCRRAFRRQVVISGPVTFQFNTGLASGVPGTTKFDEVASAAVNGYVYELFAQDARSIVDKKKLVEWLAVVSSRVKVLFGLTFKEDSLDTYFFEKGQAFYDFVFLGQRLKRQYGANLPHYVPVPLQEKLMISATTFKKSYKPNHKNSACMDKFRSLQACGGYHFPILSDRLEAAYTSLQKQGARPFNEADEEYGEETESSQFITVKFAPDDNSWPSDQWCLNLYLPEGDKLLSNAPIRLRDMETKSETASVTHLDVGIDDFDISSEEGDEAVGDLARDLYLQGVFTKTAAAIEGSEYSAEGSASSDPMKAVIEEATAVEGWADDIERSRGPLGEVIDKGSDVIPIMGSVNPATMNLVQPMYTEQQKADFQKSKAQERADRQAERERLLAGVQGSKAKLKKGVKTRGKGKQASQVDNLLGDYDYDDEDVDVDEMFQSD